MWPIGRDASAKQGNLLTHLSLKGIVVTTMKSFSNGIDAAVLGINKESTIPPETTEVTSKLP
jgi:hypothetical protein